MPETRRSARTAPDDRAIVTAVRSRMLSPPHPDVQRALAAMADMGFLEADHQRAEFRQPQPLRHLTAQHAAFGLRRPILPLPVMMSTKVSPSWWARCRKPNSARCALRLRHAVQIEPGIDLLAAARQMRSLAAADRRQRRRLRLWRRQRCAAARRAVGEAAGFGAAFGSAPSTRPAASRGAACAAA